MPSYSLNDLLLLIEQNGGPAGLDLARADLSGLDASPEVLQAELDRVRATEPGAQPVWLWPETGGLNLQEANLERAGLSQARLSRANLREANLERANLGEARLEGAILAEANLERAEAPEADLHGADLQGANLQNADLEGANLRAARLSGTNLQEANLEGANLSEADLQEVTLVGASLEGANLHAARLATADLSRASLEGANLSESNLQEARLGEASLEGADLKRANLDHADLHAASLEGANLREASLTGANLHDASLEGADLRRASLAGADLGGARLEGANLREVSLLEANLEGASLEGADLQRANLARANLRTARLKGARLCEGDLREACLEGADLEGANLHGANLEGADLSGANLDEARFDANGATFEGADWGLGVDAPVGAPRDLGEQIARDVSRAAAHAAREARRAAADATREATHWVDVAAGLVGEKEADRAEGGRFSLNLPLEGATALRLDLGLGNIELTGEERDDILLRGRGNQDELEIARSGETIRVRQKRPDHHRHWFRFGRSRRMDLAVTLPMAVGHLEARTGLGNVSGRNLKVQGTLATGKGNVHLVESRVEGEVTTGLGNVDLAMSSASTVRTGAGNVRIKGAAGGWLEATTGSGNIEIHAGRFDGLRASTGAGNVNAALALGEGEYRLETGAGVITVELPDDPSMQVEAVTGMGQVKSDWPLVRVGRPGPAAAGSTRMVGAIGDEERRARLVLRTGLGNVYLRRGSAAQAAQPSAPGEQSVPASQPASEAGEVVGAQPSRPVNPPDPDARLDILQSLARGEITVDEAEALIVQLSAQQ